MGETVIVTITLPAELAEVLPDVARLRLDAAILPENLPPPGPLEAHATKAVDEMGDRSKFSREVAIPLAADALADLAMEGVFRRVVLALVETSR